MKKLLVPLLLSLVLLGNIETNAQNDLDLKVMMGYQGWFLARGDGAAPNEWRHWFQSLTDPSLAQLNVDMWPDMSEYTKTYATSMNYPNGSNASLFSSHDASTTNLHFKWMRDYNVYGVYLQRFLGEAANDPRFFQVRNNVLQNVINASATYGRKFSIMYDISGVPDDGTLASKLISDWEYLVNTYNVTNQTGYVKQEGRPVLAIWGIGFRDRGLKPATFQQLINYFHTTAAPQYRAYIVGGVPDSWRTLNNDSESDPAWTAIYHSLDMISPWAVGRYGNVTEADSWKTNKIIPDMSQCAANGVDYMPVIFPGFSWFNMHDGGRPLNQIPRANGNFYWRQAYNAISANAKYVYVAMFDEVDEGTAMFKLAATNAQAPAGASLVTMDEDGQALPSDWYLRLANETQKMLDKTIPLTSTIPISPNGSAPAITSSSTASGTTGTAFSYTITATNNPTSRNATGLPPGLSVNTSTGVISGIPTTAGIFNATISATNASGTGSSPLTITISTPQSQSPYGGIVRNIPGTIQAEDYDIGGEGVAYHDIDAANTGGQYRNPGGVDIETCSEGGFNVGWMRTTEWIEYTVNVTTAGTYSLQARVSSGLSGRTMHVELNGVNISGTISIPNTGGWQNWQTVTVTTTSLTTGQKILRIAVDSDDFNLNHITFTAIGGTPVVSNTSLPSGTVNASYSTTITATNNPTSFGATGLPAGLSVNTSTGVISGTPTASGTFTVTLSATNASGTGTKQLSLVINPAPTGVPVISNTSLVAGSVGNSYNVSISATNSPTSYGATGLPSGLSVNTSTGVISGTPTEAGSFSVGLTATNASGTGSKTLTLSVTEPAGISSVYRTPVSITVNGSLTESGWNLIKTISKNTVGTGNNTAKFAVMWDNTNMYIGVRVLDANLFSDSPNTWEDDAVEIYIDANNNKLTTYDGRDNQIIKNYNKSTVFTKLAITGLQHAWASVTGGYSVEIAIPWTQLGFSSAPAAGTKIGFDVGYDDDDNGGTREAQAVWNGTVNNYQNTSAFGTLVLSNATRTGTARIQTDEEANIAEAETEVRYWPTEVTDELHITTDGTFERVEVVDLIGRQHISESIFGKQEITLNVSMLTGGLHIVKMRGRSKSHAFRIIKK